MAPNASSLPSRNSATSCSSDRKRSSGPEREILKRCAWAAWRAEASTRRSCANSNRGARRKFRPRARSGPQADHHVLDLGVVLQGVHREVLAVAGLLVAAVGHLGGEGDVVVDPD